MDKNGVEDATGGLLGDDLSSLESIVLALLRRAAAIVLSCSLRRLDGEVREFDVGALWNGSGKSLWLSAWFEKCFWSMGLQLENVTRSSMSRLMSREGNASQGLLNMW